jgi:D-amino-acid dehydrogenase
LNVGIVGGGAIGLASAHYLARAGAEVTVIEQGRCGEGASQGNAGWITPTLSGPIPAPGVMRQAIRWMGDPASPLLIRPRASLDFARWCWGFWRSCGEQRYREGMRAVLALNERTMELYDELRQAGIGMELHETGLLFVALDAAHLSEYERMFDDLRAAGHGGTATRMDADEVVKFEPALHPAVAGGIHAPGERHVRPETLTAGLLADLRARGVQVLEGAAVQGVAQDSGRWTVRGSFRTRVFDKILLTAGAWTGQLLRQLGTKVGLEGAKGYSLTAAGTGTRPAHALYFTEAKVGCSPFRDGVRLAGTLELAGLDLSPNARRSGALADSARRYLADWEPGGAAQAHWAGLRPTAPDGLPYIGAVPGSAGAYAATGHAMLGITLAPATGALVAQLMLGEQSPDVLRPFRLDR